MAGRCYTIMSSFLELGTKLLLLLPQMYLHHDIDFSRSIVCNQLVIDGVAEPNNQVGDAIVVFNPFKDGEKKYSPPRGMMNDGILIIFCGSRGSSPDIARSP